ncbi:phosphoribosylanthranilate isomerase [Suttonella ornithocola]|uniref:N-(5'-phosphoribosyl)anthranilate isomerase n=1 Tax=Suttonella ornithocola TaxID=279832 RepID=A0A380N0G7_9GAMM|nr:phosphoribosylanthranilate isomerase [Suttonella ornithocola]SUO97613.1 N-(5'-phosphoribosyl)anthranilate isomerase [Suttonella ornithocola]
MAVRVKICGLTRTQDVLAAVEAGADALGFVFYQKSRRAVDVVSAKALVSLVAPFVQTVGLFVNPTEEFVRAVLARVPLDCLQFHGNESSEFCHQFGRRWIKAVPMCDLSQAQAADYVARYPQADGFLFDAFGAAQMGGSGQTFAWQCLPRIAQPVILAGGLDSENVGEAIRQLRPWAVDVSSGVESAPGIKSSVKIRDFIQAAKAAVL